MYCRPTPAVKCHFSYVLSHPQLTESFTDAGLTALIHHQQALLIYLLAYQGASVKK
jgi:hypothetical protein